MIKNEKWKIIKPSVMSKDNYDIDSEISLSSTIAKSLFHDSKDFRIK